MENGKLEKELHEKTEAYVACSSLAARYAPSARVWLYCGFGATLGLAFIKFHIASPCEGVVSHLIGLHGTFIIVLKTLFLHCFVFVAWRIAGQRSPALSGAGGNQFAFRERLSETGTARGALVTSQNHLV